jgi:hypothetical protein
MADDLDVVCPCCRGAAFRFRRVPGPMDSVERSCFVNLDGSDVCGEVTCGSCGISIPSSELWEAITQAYRRLRAAVSA